MADADSASQTVEITNNDQGPRYVHSERGMEVIQKGETLSTKMAQAHIDAATLARISGADDVPMFDVKTVGGEPSGGVAEDQGKALAGLTIAQLRQLADAEGVALSDRKDVTTGEALPDLTKKDDIVAAIQAHRDANPDSQLPR